MKRNRMTGPPSRQILPSRTSGSPRWGSCITAAAAALFMLAQSGCTTFTRLSNAISLQDDISEHLIGYRNRAWSARAWHEHKDRFCNRPHLHDFCAGFRAGYESVADGGDGCTPPFPDRKYWQWQYQTAEGQQKVAAWFAGFPFGAQVAEQEGIGNFSQIMTSTTIHKEYVQAGLLEPGPHVYPIPDAAVDDLVPKPGELYLPRAEPVPLPGMENHYAPPPGYPVNPAMGTPQPLPATQAPWPAPAASGYAPTQPWPPANISGLSPGAT